MTAAGRDDERSGQRPASPNDQAETHGTPAAGDTCSHLRNRRLATSSRADFARWCALAIVLVVLLLVVFAGGALFLASSAGKALVLRTLSASLLNQLGVEARAAGLDYRPRLARRHAARRQHQATRRGAPFLNAERVEVDFSPAILRGTLVLRRLDVTRPEVVLDSTTQGASAVVPAAHVSTRSLIRHPGRAGARSHAHVRQSKRHARRCSRALAVVHRRRARSRARSGRRFGWVVRPARNGGDWLRSGTGGRVTGRNVAGPHVDHDGVAGGGDRRDRAPRRQPRRSRCEATRGSRSASSRNG